MDWENYDPERLRARIHEWRERAGRETGAAREAYLALAVKAQARLDQSLNLPPIIGEPADDAAPGVSELVPLR
jgi:hypothetical protein